MSEPAAEEIYALLDDPYARDILAATSREPMDAQTISENCEASLSTVYRRVERLEEHDLVLERLQLREDGNHYSVYEANLDYVHVDLDDGDLEMEVRLREDAADRFVRIWEGIRGD